MCCNALQSYHYTLYAPYAVICIHDNIIQHRQHYLFVVCFVQCVAAFCSVLQSYCCTVALYALVWINNNIQKHRKQHPTNILSPFERHIRGPKLGTYSDWGLSSVLVINKHLSHILHSNNVNFFKTSNHTQNSSNTKKMTTPNNTDISKIRDTSKLTHRSTTQQKFPAHDDDCFDYLKK